MTTRAELLTAVSEVISDYREGEIPRPTADHVDRWISQFPRQSQDELLREFAFTINQTYILKDFVKGFLGHQVLNPDLVGDDPPKYWRQANILSIQHYGHSQEDMRELLREPLLEKVGVGLDDCGSQNGHYLYFDDAIFSGNRAGHDLETWLTSDAPEDLTLHVIVMAAHRLGEWQLKKRLEECAGKVSKKLDLHIWASLRLENRRAYRSTSEVLWPSELPDDPAVQEYADSEKKFPFEPRQPGGQTQSKIFASEKGRQLLETHMLMAGVRIRQLCDTPRPLMRPLGFSHFGLGFGSTLVTYRNCPNNAPLALWWGDPSFGPSHPFSKWYPLLPRKTYNPEEDFDFDEFF